MKEIGGKAVLFDVPMSQYTTLRIGGNVEALYKARDLNALREMKTFLMDEGIPYLVTGRGSNLLVRDGGLNGVAIILEGSFAVVNYNSMAEPHIVAGAGMPLYNLVDFCIENGLSGAEFLAGIPGTVGGGVAMNAGSWGQEMKGVINEVTMLTGRGIVETRDKGRLKFSYRELELNAGEIILNAMLSLKFDTPALIRKKVVLNLKRRKERFPFGMPSAGSIFKNPKGDYAGRLIEAVGLKGKTIGGAMISAKHANVIVNKDKASSSDILSLMDLAAAKVREMFNIQLLPEIKVVGEL
ncbi:MAG: UDP-N-acetylmuramate dehydrogenase [Deltaproteobacteria bacterium]|nr:UDP-N-acetylmuramate dehydrogenase [Deltaproteobacteria bacterium]